MGKKTKLTLALTGIIAAAGAAGAAGVVLRLHASPEGKHAVASAPAPANRCPFRTPEEWNVFLRASALHREWGVTCEDSTCDFAFNEAVERDIVSVFRDCADTLDAHPALAACTRNLRRFVPAWLRQHDEDSYGFRRSNHEYLRAQEAADVPAGMMDPPPEILAALPSRDRVIDAARRSGLRYLTHDSAIDNTRTFVFNPDPQGRFDQWLLLNLQPGTASVTLNQPLSILVVQKKDAAGNPLPKVRLHFRDYNISPAAHGFRVTLDEAKNGKCYSCHVNGVRQLIARRTPVLEARPVRGEPGYDEAGNSPAPADFALERLREFNRKLRSYGRPDWRGDIDAADFGPALGKEQGCIDCHDGVSRAALNIATSLVQLEKKMYYQLSMPPDGELQKLLERNEMYDPALQPAEAAHLEAALKSRASLVRELEDSRLPLLREWLLSVPCRSEGKIADAPRAR